MAWYHSLFERATDKELTEAVADSYLPDFQARILRAIDNERLRRQDNKPSGGQAEMAGDGSASSKPTVRIIWTSHGHWCGVGEPTGQDMRVRPARVARCGGPERCAQCSAEARAGQELPRV